MKGVGKAKRARRPAGDQRAGEPPFGTLRWRRAAPAAEDSGLGGLVPLNLGGLFLDRRLQLAAVAGGLLADARRLAGAATQVVELRTAHIAEAHHLDGIDERAVQREDALDTLAVRQLAHGEGGDRKSTRLNSSHYCATRMPTTA